MRERERESRERVSPTFGWVYVHVETDEGRKEERERKENEGEEYCGRRGFAVCVCVVCCVVTVEEKEVPETGLYDLVWDLTGRSWSGAVCREIVVPENIATVEYGIAVVWARSWA